MLTPAQLRRRNALWARLRAAGPDSPDAEAAGFGAALAELVALTSWPRERVLAGLGLTEADLAQGDSP